MSEEPRGWRSVTNIQPYGPTRWVRFTLAWEVAWELKGLEGFRVLDMLIRKRWPDCQGVELMLLEDVLTGARMTFRVW